MASSAATGTTTELLLRLVRQAEADPRAAVAVSALPAELRRHLLSSRFACTRLQHLLERLQRLGLLQIEAEPPSRLELGLGLG